MSDVKDRDHPDRCVRCVYNDHRRHEPTFIKAVDGVPNSYACTCWCDPINRAKAVDDMIATALGDPNEG